MDEMNEYIARQSSDVPIIYNKTKKRAKPVMHEAAEQEALFDWAQAVRRTFPEVDLLFHVPNGGSRNKFEAANLKKQGVKAGVPDLFLPVARGGFHGFLSK